LKFRPKNFFEKQAEELGKNLKHVFHVHINHLNEGDFTQNWILEIIVSNGDILNIEHLCKGYGVMSHARISSGHLILNSWKDTDVKIPLIDNYVDQFHHAAVITTISVVKKKMKKKKLIINFPSFSDCSIVQF